MEKDLIREVKRAIRESSFNQSEVASLSGISPATLSKWLTNGDLFDKAPYKVLLKMCDVLELDSSKVLGISKVIFNEDTVKDKLPKESEDFGEKYISKLEEEIKELKKEKERLFGLLEKH